MWLIEAVLLLAVASKSGVESPKVASKCSISLVFDVGSACERKAIQTPPACRRDSMRYHLAAAFHFQLRVRVNANGVSFWLTAVVGEFVSRRSSECFLVCFLWFVLVVSFLAR